MVNYLFIFAVLTSAIFGQVYIHQDSGFKLPEILDGFWQGKRTLFEDKCCGIHVVYKGKSSAIISVYVYPTPMQVQQSTKLPVDTLPNIMKGITEQILRVEQIKEKDVSIFSEEKFNIKVGEEIIFGQKLSLVLARTLQKVFTTTYIFFLNKRFFLKVRASFEGVQTTEEKNVEDFITQLLEAQQNSKKLTSKNIVLEKTQDIIKMVDRFLQFPLADEKAPAIIVESATRNDNVMVILYSDLAWLAKYKFLKAAYVAGNMRKQLVDGVKGNSTEEGLRAVVQVYQNIRKQHPHFIAPEVEQLLTQKKKKK